MRDDGGLEQRDPETRLRSLVEAQFDSVFRFFARRVGPELVRDLTADTFQGAVSHALRYDAERGSETAWLFSIAHHVLSHHRRSELRRLKAYAKIAGEWDLVSGNSDRADEDLDDVIVARVGRALRHLPNGQRDAFMLVAVDGVSYADAALVLGVPDGTVRSRVSRARSCLRRSAGLPDAQSVGEPATIRGGD